MSMVMAVGNSIPVHNMENATHAPASNTAAVNTYALKEVMRYVVHYVQWSYTAAPTAGKLTVAFGVAPTTRMDVDITAAGPGALAFSLDGAINEQCVITLSAGGVGISGKLNSQVAGVAG